MKTIIPCEDGDYVIVHGTPLYKHGDYVSWPDCPPRATMDICSAEEVGQLMGGN